YFREVWKVTELLFRVQSVIEGDLRTIWLEGEVSNFRRPSSGHAYFTLKDSRSQIRVVMFRQQVRALPFTMEDGQHVLCFGRLNVYTARGDLQLVADTAEPWGQGLLRQEFDRLKARLDSEGLFASEHKAPLPLMPGRIFLITSPTGAAFRDFVRHAHQRHPGIGIILCPVQVQGGGAAEEIRLALKTVQKNAVAGDVAVLARGGGSIEDLWAFNDEELAWEIFRCSIPVVSAVGHEIDFTISDLVADCRAATPTAAAHIILPPRKELQGRVADLEKRMHTLVFHRIEKARRRLEVLKQHLKDPEKSLINRKLLLDDLTSRLHSLIQNRISSLRNTEFDIRERLAYQDPKRRIAAARSDFRIISRRLVHAAALYMERKHNSFTRLTGKLDSISPLAVLSRGYSLVYHTGSGMIVKQASQVSKGDSLTIRPHKGTILCKVLDPGNDQDDIT
ncbi:MAG TPA: exodeoxyribonuclease VII large subunit, partial [Thermodesulfobacteriaceae bacterium]|nr:exodeoxyribonuclease VII large subunit [Thermodesulfobacteriaceae bacterium]